MVCVPFAVLALVIGFDVTTLQKDKRLDAEELDDDDDDDGDFLDDDPNDEHADGFGDNDAAREKWLKEKIAKKKQQQRQPQHQSKQAINEEREYIRAQAGDRVKEAQAVLVDDADEGEAAAAKPESSGKRRKRVAPGTGRE